MFNWNFLKKKEKKELEKKPEKVFSTDNDCYYIDTEFEKAEYIKRCLGMSFQRGLNPVNSSGKGVAMDSNLKPALQNNPELLSTLPSPISNLQFAWYASQGFIGHQACAVLSQHWLIDKACSMPGEDAVRKGYKVTINDGTEVDDSIIDKIRDYDKKYKIMDNLRQFSRMGRIFGVRHALFIVDSTDPKYYEKPFNPDSVTPGSYKGISQIDPYWMMPIVTGEGVYDPASMNYYEPEYWIISGKKIHRTHFVILRSNEVPDILKPTYYFGGVPLPQKIYERVYGSERSANEGPQLLLTKRSKVYKTDMSKVMMNPGRFEERVAFSVRYADSYGVRVIDKKDDDLIHLETNLADIDSVIMTQYQLVAAIANVPAVKLLGTSPKGFNATGEYEQKNYHEYLETVQKNELNPLLDRHHDLLIRSEICPNEKIPYFSTQINWEAINSVSAKEQAEINKLEAEKDGAYVVAGAISSEEIRNKLINDPDSGFNGLSKEDLPDPLLNEIEKANLLEGEREVRGAQRI